jgi:hypothetical protein
MKRLFFSVLLCAGSVAGQAHAQNVDYGIPTSPGPFVKPVAGVTLPLPRFVPGKEFTTDPNSNHAGAAAPGQLMAWDGLGGTVDLFNFGGAEVDAIANYQDALFSSVLSNSTNLLLSFEGDLGQRSIYAVSQTGAVSLWASSDTVMTPVSMGGNRPNPFDLNGLEVWGPDYAQDPDNARDSNVFSLVGDTTCSVIRQETAACILSRAELAAAIGNPTLESIVDLDGLMVLESPTNQYSLIFSIQPVAGFDGGEIWNYEVGAGAGQAIFLNFGGQIWNTDFDIQSYFANQGYATGTENIDAIEAASTPGPLPVLATTAVFGSVKRLRKLSGSLKASAHQ